MMGAVGHARAFAAMAGVGAIATLLHPVLADPLIWAGLRIGSGMAVAGCYTVVESWIQAKVENHNRGRVVGVYRIVDMTASVAAQGVIALLDPASYVAYNIVATLCILCLFPLVLTRSTPPPAASAPRLRPLRTLRLSPMASVGVAVVGLTSSSFRMVGPVYAAESGLAVTEIALFMAAGVGGGAAAQWPAGWLSDRYDRRSVLIGVSVAACVVCAAIAGGAFAGAAWLTYLAAFVFGAAAFPLFSIAAAHANDFAAPDEVVELNASLLFIYAVGAIVSPLAAAVLIEAYGPPALFVYVGVAHVALILFGLWRMTRRRAAAAKTPHRYLPRTSFTLARLFGSHRK